ncbi:patatin-like phospholipase family protein [Caulobacter segnis]|uniref:patatin-like phospholipase family protein n=1 Tax=Caulobacter segnis TaxID=88688 RepID=UPI001CBD36D1|nr:patatin-like phospholipase family protein [Caulobacter segnis]UAL09649.1 patatin-like phospholipase family protein [Caulobacter segnis]
MARLLAALMSVLLLAACGSLPRDPFTASDLAGEAPRGLSDVRFNASDAGAGIRFAEAARTRRVGQKTFDVLAISGGGSNGAYGAGVLVGWTKTGHRPEFDIVTGVSTGALTAPFAFLGPDWDRRLTEAYTSKAADRILERRGLDLLFRPGFYDTKALRTLVGKYVDPPMLWAIAAEHARGRRLLIATTNLDTEETVIWDMGAIAARGDEASLKLFRDVLVASASIPGVFPPTLIEVEGSGRRLSEMHVDGGVTTPFFVAPESLLLWTAPKGGEARPGRITVLVNGKVGGAFGFTKGGTLSVMGRSWLTMSKALMRTHLTASAAFARRNGGSLVYSAIPDDAAGDTSGLDFSAANRQLLFELGRQRAEAGTAWTTPATPEDAKPPIAVPSSPPAARP